MVGLPIWFWLTVALATVVSSNTPTATEVTVSELLVSGVEWADQRITVEGELVGDYGFRPDGWMWTQLNGDAYGFRPLAETGEPVGGNSGIGVRMPHELADGLDPPGRYRTRGPIVRVTGIWRWHDPRRQGESHLEVESLVLVEPGRRLSDSPNWPAAVVGLALVALMPLILRERRTERPA